ncbi:hypothetical protein ACSQ6I_26130 [Anabaena sp. WFMT]|uniref:hypothetical protein n=1 Tax=Anabaena sp. WFMT TaxID=3449730 RepID=UPI003F219723
MSSPIIQSDLLVELSPEKQQLVSGGCRRSCCGDKDKGDDNYNWEKYKPNDESYDYKKPMYYQPMSSQPISSQPMSSKPMNYRSC